MSTSLVLVLLLILIVGLSFFWLFYKNSNSTQQLSEKYLLDNLAEKDLSAQQRTDGEQQLSLLLQKKHQSTSHKVFILVAIITLPTSLLLYAYMGNPKAISYTNTNSQSGNQNSQISQQGQDSQMNMNDAIKQLEVKLAENPNDVDGQLLYARSQVSLKDYDKAVKAYRKVNELAPNEPVVLTELAESIALFNDNRSFLGEPEILLQQAVAIDNTNQKALWLYGMTFYEKKDFVKTNELWTNLYELLDNENAKIQLLKQLTEVRAKLGVDTANVNDENATDSVQLNVNINYDKENLPPQTIKRATLFLYTKAPTGMPMPIAVIKKSLEVINNEFPMRLTVSDVNNLQSSRKLSDFESVTIGARISYSGDPIAQPGDMQSAEITIDLPYTETIELFIDQVKTKN